MLKLFNVDVENVIVVLAEDCKSAEDVVSNMSPYEILEGVNYDTREITKLNQVDSIWMDSLPYISTKNSNNEEYDDISSLTCKEIMEKIEEERQKVKDKEEADKLQMKFDFHDQAEDF